MIRLHLLASAALSAAALAPATIAAAAPAAAAPTPALAPAPLHAEETARAERFVAGMIAGGINVPLPVDVGGGPTHEQHKRNYRALALAGELYRITGEAPTSNMAACSGRTSTMRCGW